MPKTEAMTDRGVDVRKTRINEYVPIKWNGKNESGIWPTGDRVLVCPDEVIKQSAGGLIIPETTREKHGLASESGTIIAVGEGAFAWAADRSRPFIGRKPQPGDRVLFQRYTGMEEFGGDGRFYRVMSDNAIGAVFADSDPAKS